MERTGRALVAVVACYSNVALMGRKLAIAASLVVSGWENSLLCAVFEYAHCRRCVDYSYAVPAGKIAGLDGVCAGEGVCGCVGLLMVLVVGIG